MRAYIIRPDVYMAESLRFYLYCRVRTLGQRPKVAPAQKIGGPQRWSDPYKTTDHQICRTCNNFGRKNNL